MLASQPLGIKYCQQCLKFGRNADVVHLHVPNMLGALCALLLGKKPRLLVHWHSDVINKGILGRILRPLEVALLRRADKIIATSRVYAEASDTLRPFREKIRIVPIGVADTKLDNSSLDTPLWCDEQIRGRKIILAVGRLVPYKGFDVLIEATKHISDQAVVVIVGSGPLHGKLKQAIDDANLKDRIVMAGRLSASELSALFARASLFCLPSISRAEAFGVVLLEAMACGLPIVATNIDGSGVSWVSLHDTSGLNVPVGDPIALAQACNQILETPALCARLAEGSPSTPAAFAAALMIFLTCEVLRGRS